MVYGCFDSLLLVLVLTLLVGLLRLCGWGCGDCGLVVDCIILLVLFAGVLDARFVVLWLWIAFVVFCDWR